MKHSLLVIVILLVSMAQAQLRINVGDKSFSDWQGISSVSKNEATFDSGELINTVILMENSTPGMPEKYTENGIITIDISALNAVSFKVKLGGDFPLGNESARRKTMAVRSNGKDARYLSVIEPYENESVIKSVKAKSANKLVVELKDGKVQEIILSDMDSETNQINVKVWELLNGNIIIKGKII